MSLSIIPESAPFSPEQRAWLNGFLAGWTGLAAMNEANMHLAGQAVLDQAGPATLPPQEVPTEPDPADLPWHDANLTIEERLKLAKDQPLNYRLMSAMAQLDCGACGYLCHTYSAAIAKGEEKNLTLCSPGGKATAKAVKSLLKEKQAVSYHSAEATNGQTAVLNGQEKPSPNPSPADRGGGFRIDSEPAETGYSKSNPFPATLKECRNLNSAGSAKHTCHVAIDLAGSDLDYRVGDALGVVPTNCPELVERILARLSANGNEMVSGTNGESITLHQALLEQLDLHTVNDELVESMIAGGNAGDELRKLLEDDLLDEIDLLDALELAPAHYVAPETLITLLNPLRPRLYSIASSLRAHPGEVHLTVGRVCCERRGRQRKGVASTMFADRLAAGEKVRVFVHASSDFTVPADPAAPMIMVGPGTGIAPFRAFLEERIAGGAPGKNWLFFGDQHEESDFLYREELETWCQAGSLSHLTTAFSRDQEQKVYVQDRMREHGAELFRWLEEGGYFFVCGDARRMAVDVDRALHEVIASQGNLSAEQAAGYVSELKRSHRYVRDVY